MIHVLKNIHKPLLIFFMLFVSIYLLANINSSEIIADDIPKEESASKVLPIIREDIREYEDAKTTEIEQNLQVQALRQTKINNLTRVFNDYGGYMNSSHAAIMVDTLDTCGGDYRVLGAIAGKESGFGRINYKLYNPFGYLNGVQYTSYEEALERLSCQIAKQYLVPCDNDLYCIATTGYAGSDTNIPVWINSLNILANRIEPL